VQALNKMIAILKLTELRTGKARP